jgi:hypothetical protein
MVAAKSEVSIKESDGLDVSKALGGKDLDDMRTRVDHSILLIYRVR